MTLLEYALTLVDEKLDDLRVQETELADQRKRLLHQKQLLLEEAAVYHHGTPR
jgi:hypothetical protein